MVDRALLAAKIASVRDAVARIREVLPTSREAFLKDRTAREVVLLNLFVALQESLALATHWLADEGLGVPDSYAQVLLRLARIHEIASARLEDLLAFCEALARRTSE